jgi:hypothetical protein
MPDLSGNLATIRQPYSVDLYFTPIYGEEVFSGTVASTPTFPAKALALSGAAGSASDVKRGMRVTVETSGGIYKGETHVRAAGTISSTYIPIRETSKGVINIAAGDVIRVYNAIYLQDKLVSADPTFSPDSLAYGTQNSVVPPIAISGGHFAAYVDSGQVYATIVFAGSESYAVDADSGGTVTHAWDFPTATGTTTSTSANPSFTFPVGYHFGWHIVTDSSNSATWTQFIMGQVYDASTPPYACVLEDVSASVDAGWSARVQVFDAAGLTTIPDHCFGIVWSRETYNGTVQSFGNVIPTRSALKMVGYVARETVRFDPVDTTLTFELISPLARLQALPGYSKVMINNSTPDKWREVEDLSVKRALVLLLRYYTNLTEIFDFLYDADTYAFSRFYVQKNTPSAQTLELADGVDARFVCNRTGRFMVQKRQELTLLADRSALVTTLTLTTQDIERYEFNRDHYRTVELLDVRGFKADQDSPTPLFSYWPGLGPGQGTQSSVTERLIAASQSDLNKRAGLRGAVLDGVFIDSAGEYRKAFDLRLSLVGAYDVFDYYKEWIALSIDDSTNLRGVDLSAYRYIFHSANITYDHSAAMAFTELVLRAETAAPAGTTYKPTTPDNNNLPDYTPPDLDVGFTPVPAAVVPLPVYNPDSPESPIRVFGLAAGSAQAAIAESYDSGAGTIAWTEISTGLGAGIGRWAAGDPYDYGRMFVLMSDGLYKCEDIWSFDSWSLVASNTDMFASGTVIGLKIQMNITKRGHIIVLSGSKIAVSFDYGLSWTQVDPSGAGAFSTSTAITGGDFAINQRGGGVVMFTYYIGGGNSRTYRSTDNGLTFSLQATHNTAFIDARLFIPYCRRGGLPNTADTSMELWLQYSGGNEGGIQVSYDAGVTRTATLAFNSAGIEVPAAARQNVLSLWTWDSNYQFSAGRGTGGGANRWSIFATTDAVTYTEPVNGVAGSQSTIAVNGYPTDPLALIMFSSNSAICAISLDGAVTRFGAAPAFFSPQQTSYAEFSLAGVVAPS